MKKLTFSILAAIFMLGTWSNASAQKTFSGTISYDMQMSGNEEIEQAMSMFQITMDLSFLGEKSATKMNMAGMMDMNSVFDTKKQEGVILMSMMGKNIAVEMDEDDMKKYQDQQRKNQAPPKIKYMKKKTKKIAGYKCYRAEAEMEGADAPVVMYIAEDIQPKGTSQWQMQYPDLVGFPLMIELQKEGMTVTFSAQDVDKSKPDASVFDMTIPDGYQKMTMEELEQMQGAGSGGLFGM
ncbi:MAG: hypothetical protein MK212_16570 [Saprospiraceae bacterium]|nr:hypothetical protein [Saprospiraceae bacterium]